MGYLQYGRHGLRRQIIRFSDANVLSSDMVVVNPLPLPLLYASQGIRHKSKLQVILTTNIDKLGKAGDTVKVAPGYFRNHLMPKLLAVPNIHKFAYLLIEQRKIYQPVEEEEEEEEEEQQQQQQQEVTLVKELKEDRMKEYEKAALRLNKAKLVLRRFIDDQKAKLRATKDEPLELRSSVTKEDLVAEVARQLCVNIAPENLHLLSPLSIVGEYEVPLRLPRSIPLLEGNVNWSLKVKIRSK